ncbi:MAG: AraC-like DNA-binding protein [Oceanicoccus sp.]|jgi:AraC-like DNA-binding protein
MKLHIKNMVCQRCIIAVESILSKLALRFHHIQLGEIDFGTLELNTTSPQYHALDNELTALGFEILNNKQSKTIEAIKKICLQQLIPPNTKQHTLSKQISDTLHTDYSHLSQMFSAVEGLTIEQYFIAQRIEKVKEFLIYDEKSLSEIAFDLGFSSVAHLSGQFKKVTGMTPSVFRSLKNPQQRRGLDKL